MDALLVIDDLMENFPRSLPIPRGPARTAPLLLDTNRDGLVTPIDALLIIQELMAPQAIGQGSSLRDGATR